jgi:hypothetical protein
MSLNVVRFHIVASFVVWHVPLHTDHCDLIIDRSCTFIALITLFVVITLLISFTALSVLTSLHSLYHLALNVTSLNTHFSALNALCHSDTTTTDVRPLHFFQFMNFTSLITHPHTRSTHSLDTTTTGVRPTLFSTSSSLF